MTNSTVQYLNNLVRRNLQPAEAVAVDQLVSYTKLPYGMVRFIDKCGNDYYGMEKDICMEL